MLDGAGGRGRFEIGVEGGAEEAPWVLRPTRAEERPQVLGRAGAQEMWTMMPQSRHVWAEVSTLIVS